MKGRMGSHPDLSSHGALSGSPVRDRRAGMYRQPSQWLPGLSLDDAVLPDRSTTQKPIAASRRSILSSAGISRSQSRIFDDSTVTAGYASVPLLEMQKLPRGGMSIETKAVGRVQLGLPPETIKDSMQLGLDVPRVYIVPVERFCREMGPALGINLAEFEFPAYFNFFVRGKKCVLVVDSDEAEEDIRSVFEETLLGPKQFRTASSPKDHEPDDFDPSYPKENRPDFSKEFRHFRTAEKTEVYKELSTDMLLEFCHFRMTASENVGMDSAIGVPPIPPGNEDDMFAQFNASVPALRQSRASQLSLIEALLEPDAKILEMMEPDDDEETGSAIGVPPIPPGSKDDLFAQCNASSPALRQSRASRFSLESGALLEPDIKILTIDETMEPDDDWNAKDSLERGALLETEVKIPKIDEMLESDDDWKAKDRRRGSFESRDSMLTPDDDRKAKDRRRCSFESHDSMFTETSHVFDDDKPRASWLFSRVKWLGAVATVWPMNATADQIKRRSLPRAEIFKMPGGTEYVIHDVDENNVIVGKALFSGSVQVPDEIAVEGFLSPDACPVASLPGDPSLADSSLRHDAKPGKVPFIFHPPSFGLTVLGNSHGFDKNGSTSGYVLWINGRGVMIDPPPYASATLEREGIRPQMIIGVIITHCHADHDAGAFQKVLTGSKVSVITTPTIYKSFIRKYAALSGLSPTLLRHSHRHRAAIIGQPLRFLGATFHFTYTLHTIPCIGFKVEWRGRSMVFTGDHLNLPPLIEDLEKARVLSKGRADELRRFPLQDCDALLHEAGAPPIHTPLSVLEALPEHVKERLYVVHTSALPPDSGLRVAPTGTAGTIRLDTKRRKDPSSFGEKVATDSSADLDGIDPESLDGSGNRSLSYLGDLFAPNLDGLKERSIATKVPPLVYLRPASLSDAWFMLNLFSAIPFFSTLTYVGTMEILEIAKVEVFCQGDVVVRAPRRIDALCVIWEGTCAERRGDTMGAIEGYEGDGDGDSDGDFFPSDEADSPTLWYAGDWIGPVALQPDVKRSALKASNEPLQDIIAVPSEGVKVILLPMKDLEAILKRGSKPYRKYLELQRTQAIKEAAIMASPSDGLADLSADRLLQVLQCNFVLGNLSALQKRSLESIAEGPRVFGAGSTLWCTGDHCNYSFLLVAGTVSFKHTHRPRGSSIGSNGETRRRPSLGAIVDVGDGRFVEADKLLPDVPAGSEYYRLESLLTLRAETFEMEDGTRGEHCHSAPRDRFANKVLAKLYASRNFTTGMVFSRGCFLGDTTRMVNGDLVYDAKDAGEKCHSSTMVVGHGGCIAMVFPRSTFIPFLDANPGLLLCLLGTQVVV